jgi:HD-like signal output (HDOD) protein
MQPEVGFVQEMISISLGEAVRAFEALGPLPAISKRLFELAEDADISSTDLAEVLALDPSLTVRLLAEANKKAEAHDVSTAAAIVEHQQLLKIVRSSHSYNLTHITRSLTGFWSNSVCCALAASAIARRFEGDAASMHTIGLLHNVGGALLYLIRPRQITQILEGRSGKKAAELAGPDCLELDIYQAELTSQIIRHFGLPDFISQVILYCHEPHRAQDYANETWVLHVAQAIAQEMRPKWKNGPVRDAKHGLHPHCPRFIDNLALMIDQIKREVEMAFDYACEMIQPSIF